MKAPQQKKNKGLKKAITDNFFSFTHSFQFGHCLGIPADIGDGIKDEREQDRTEKSRECDNNTQHAPARSAFLVGRFGQFKYLKYRSFAGHGDFEHFVLDFKLGVHLFLRVDFAFDAGGVEHDGGNARSIIAQRHGPFELAAFKLQPADFAVSIGDIDLEIFLLESIFVEPHRGKTRLEVFDAIIDHRLRECRVVVGKGNAEHAAVLVNGSSQVFLQRLAAFGTYRFFYFITPDQAEFVDDGIQEGIRSSQINGSPSSPLEDSIDAMPPPEDDESLMSISAFGV